MKSYPFKEEKIKNNVFIRTFDQNINSEELVWHRDKEDRIIEVIEEENQDWFIQMDNELPKALSGRIFIPKECYHRVIKGTGNLVIKLTKLST